MFRSSHPPCLSLLSLSLIPPLPIPSPSSFLLPSRSVSSVVTTLEIAASKASIPPTNPHVCYTPRDLVEQEYNTVDGIERIRKEWIRLSSTPGGRKNFSISPFLDQWKEGNTRRKSALSTISSSLIHTNSDLSSLQIKDLHSPHGPSSLTYKGFLLPRFQVSVPRGPAWFLPSSTGGGRIESQYLIRNGKLYYVENSHYQMVDVPYIESPLVLTIINPRGFDDDNTIQFSTDHVKYNKLPKHKTSIEDLLGLDKEKQLSGQRVVNNSREMTKMYGTIAVPTFESIDRRGGDNPKELTKFSFRGEGLTYHPRGAKGLRYRPATPQPRFFLSGHRPFIWGIRHPQSGIWLMGGVTEETIPFDSKAMGVIWDRQYTWFDKVPSEFITTPGQG